MAAITIRNLDESLKAQLRIRAAEHGRSMEAEAREILKRVLANDPKKPNLAESIRRRVAKFGGVNLEIPPREPVRDPPTFGE
jgi:plasmid stability protein